jgi:predicted transcriptional regulator of viral defense system
MDFERLLEIIGDEPVFETSLLLAGNINPNGVRLQLNRWTKSGRIHQLRRGLYTVAPPYQRVKPHPFVIANRLQRASYVSMQSALAFYDLIPDTVNVTVSIAAGRPERLSTPLGIFEFRHIKPDLFKGYRMTELRGQQALVATPEKALLDLIYLQPNGETKEYLQELRLQNLDRLNLDELRKQEAAADKPKLRRSVEVISALAKTESRDYEDL